jgi:hypothetical protein
MANRRNLRAKQRAHLQRKTPQARVRIAEFGGFEILRAGGGPLFFWAEHGRGFGIQAFRSERLIYGQALS